MEKVCSGFCSFEKQTNRLQRTSSIFITPVIPSCAFVIGHGRYLSYLELVLQALPFSIPKEFISRVLQRVIKKKEKEKKGNNVSTSSCHVSSYLIVTLTEAHTPSETEQPLPPPQEIFIIAIIRAYRRGGEEIRLRVVVRRSMYNV